MRLRKALLAVLVVIAAVGCGNKGYVRTSLDNQRGFERTAREIHVSDKRRGSDIHLELLEIQGYLSAGDFDRARREAASAVKRDPRSADAHTYLAVALENTGDVAASGRHYLQATQLAPANGAVLGNYGGWLCSQGRAEESLAWFDRAVAAPGYANQSMALANAGVCAMQAGQESRADRYLRRAIEVDPVNATALAALARRAFSAGRAFEARAFSERRLAAATADPQALLLASQIEHKLGDSVAAARYVARLKMEFPDASEARNSTMGDGGRQ